MWTLFVVALVALGLMATVSLQNGMTGEFTAPKPPKFAPKPAPAPGPVIVAPGRSVETTYVYEDTDDSPKLTRYDCTLAREVRRIDDKLGIVSSTDLLSTLSTCDSYNI